MPDIQKISFISDRSEVYNKTLLALERRKFNILEADAHSGFIHALSAPLLKPKVDVTMQIEQENGVTLLKMHTQLKYKWFASRSYYLEAVENRLIKTLCLLI